MINCSLTPDQIRTLRVKISGDLLDILADPASQVDVKSYLRDLYNLVESGSNGNKNLALDYARMGSVIISQLVTNRPTDIAKLLFKGLDLNELMKKNIEFADPNNGLNLVGEYVAPIVSEEVIEAIIEQEEKEIQQKTVQDQVSERTVQLERLRPRTAVSTTINELLDPDDPSLGANSAMAYYTKFVKNILREHIGKRVGSSELSGIDYPGIYGGLFITMMRYNQIPEGQLHPKMDLGRAEDKNEYDNGFVYVITDRDGNPVIFDQDYKVSGTGKMIYYNTRFLPPKQDGKFILTNVKNVQNPKELSKNLGISELEAEKRLDEQFKSLEQAYEYLKANPTGSIRYSINGGSYGAVVNANATYKDPSTIDFQNAVKNVMLLNKQQAIDTTGSPNSKGGFYLGVSGVGAPMFMKVKKISDADVNLIYNVLTKQLTNQAGQPVSLETRRNIIYTYLKPSAKDITITIDAEKNRLVLKYKNEVIDLDNEQAVKNAIAKDKSGNAREYTFLTNKFNSEESVPFYSVTVDERTGGAYISGVKAMSPMEYISHVAEVKVELESDNTIKQYNPYFTLVTDLKDIGKTVIAEQAPEAPVSEVKELKDAIVDRLKNGETITGTISRPTNSVTAFEFNEAGKPTVKFYNRGAQPVDHNDINKKATLKLVETVTTEDGREFKDVVEVYIGDKYVGNIQETDFKQSPKTEEAIAKAEPVVKEQEGKSSADVDVVSKILKNDDFLKRMRNKLDNQTNIRATAEQVKLAKEWYENSPLAQFIPFNVAFNVVNTKTRGSIATWDADGITLFKGSDYSDLYHEAWHGFTQTFLTKEQRDGMYAEARKNKGTFRSYKGREVAYENATREELEEKLAEDFREFMLSKGKKVNEKAPVKNKIFKLLLDILNYLFGKSTVQDIQDNSMGNPVISEMFEKLRVGDLSQYTFNQANAEFTVLNSTIEPLDPLMDSPGTISRQDAKELVDSVDSLIGELIDKLNDANDTKVFTRSLLLDEEGRTLAYKYVEEQLTNKLEQLLVEHNSMAPDADRQEIDYKISLLSYALRNYGDSNNPFNTFGLVKYHGQTSEFLEFEDRLGDTAEDVNVYERNEFDRKSGNETAMKALAGTSLLYTIRSLYAHDAEGNTLKNILGFPKLADFNRSWNRITNITEGSTNVDDIYQKLQAASEDYPIVKQFLNKIGSPSNLENSSVRLWSDIEKIMTMPRIGLVSLRVKVENSKPEGSNKVMKTVVITATQSTGEYTKVGRKWDSQFAVATGPYISINENNVNTLNVDKVLADFPIVTYDNAFAFMRAVGMPLEESKVAMAAFKDSTMLVDVRNIHTTLKGIQEYHNQYSPTNKIAITKPSEILKDFKIKINLDPGVSESEKRRALSTQIKLGGSTATFNNLQKFQLKWSDDFSDTTVSNAENENQYERSLRSTASQMVTKINAANTETELTQDGVENADDLSMNHLSRRRNPFMKTSMFFNKLFNRKTGEKNTEIVKNKMNTARIELMNMSGVSRELTSVKGAIENSGISSSSADGVTKRLEDMYMMMLYGVNEATRHADKSTTYLYKIVGADGKVHLIDIASFSETIGENSSAGVKAFVNQLTEYLGSEHERIRKLENGDPAGSVTVGKSNYYAVGSKLAIFDKILSTETKAVLDNMPGSIETAEQFKAYLNEEKNIDLKNAIQKEIAQYLFAKANTITEKLNSVNFFENDQLVDELVKRMLKTKQRGYDKSETFFSLSPERKKEIVNSIAVAYAANDWLHKYESTLLFYGDPALYDHTKDEFFKRNAGFSATGDIPRTDKSMIEYINAKLRENSFASKLGITPKSFGKTMSAAVMQDTATRSVYLDEYLSYAKEKEEARLRDLGASDEKIKGALDKLEEIFKDAYASMKEGDGQGWINFDAYRSLLLSLNKWSHYQEQLYQKVINNETVNVEELLQFFPVKKMQYWGPLKTDGLPVYGFHKYSLMPLIPNITAGTHMETLQRRMLEQGLDYSMFQSGSKINTITTDGVVDKFYNDNSNKEDMSVAFADPGYTFTKNNIFLDYFKDQLEVTDAYKGKVTFPTQLRSLIEEGLMENGVPTDWKPEIKDKTARIKAWNEDSNKKESNNYRLLTAYESKLARLVELKKEKLRKEIGSNPEDLIKFIKRELTRKEMAEHTIDFIDFDAQKNKFKNSLDLSLMADSIERGLVAIVQKNLINQKVNGESLVQVAGTGFEKINFRKPSKEEAKQYGQRGLRFYNLKDGKTQAMQIKIAMQGKFKELLETTAVIELAREQTISRLDALNMIIKDEEWLNDGDNRKLITSVAVRIPTQGLNSMEFMEIAEFLPETSGNIIILPAEIVGKTGGDFDIDKMFTLFPNLKSKNEDGENIVEFAGGDTVEGIENDILFITKEILEKEDNFLSLITPNTTITLKDIAAKISEKLKGKKQKRSATDIFESEVNLEKHQSNNIGKMILGIIAVNNTFSTIFNRTGLILEPDRVVTSTEAGAVYGRQELELPHNKVDGRISLSNLYSADGIDKIADLISQMINGSVDVAKDDWIFDLQADKEAISKIVFMIQAGVPAKQVALFMSQPIIREYIKKQKMLRSKFNEPLGIKDPGTYYRITARDQILFDDEFGFGLEKKDYTDDKSNVVRKYKLWPTVEAIAKSADKKLFSEESLEKNINSKEYTAVDRAVFAHFLEIEEMANGITQLTQNLNFDTSKSATLFEARTKLDKLNDLANGVSQESVDMIIKNSPKGKFKVQDFVIDILKDMFPLRDGDKLNNHINNELLARDKQFRTKISVLKKQLGIQNDEDLINKYRSDLIAFIFQQDYYKFDPNAKTYNGTDVTYDIQEVKSLTNGAFVKDGVLYADKAKIKEIFTSERYKAKQAWGYAIAPLDPSVLSLYDVEVGEALYFKYTYQREINRSIASNSFENISKTKEFFKYKEEFKDDANADFKAYESVLRDITLDGLNYHGHMFFGKRAYAKQIMELKETNPELFEKYQFLSDLEIVTTKYGATEISNLRIAGRPKGKDIERLYDNLQELSDASVKKVKDSFKNAQLSALFQKMTHFALLQSGIDTASTFSLIPFVSNESYLNLVKGPYEKFLADESTDALELYDELFELQYSEEKNKALKVKVKAFAKFIDGISPYKQYTKDYIDIDAPNGKISIELDKVTLIKDNLTNTMQFAVANGALTEATMKEFASALAQSSDKQLVVFNEIDGRTKNAQGNNSIYRAMGEYAYGIVTKKGSMPTTPAGKQDKKLMFTDATLDDNKTMIDAMVNELEGKQAEGYELLFDAKGYGQYMAGYNEYSPLKGKPDFEAPAPETFNYLSQQLFEKFGYLNPNYLKTLEGRRIVQSRQPVTDDEIFDLKKSCKLA